MQASHSATNRIARIRRKAGLRPIDVAAALDVKEQTVNRWEAGKTAIPDKRKFALADLFGCTVPYLMGWDEPNGDGNDGHGQQQAA